MSRYRQKEERETARNDPLSLAELLEELGIPLEEVKEALEEGGYLE